MFLVVNGQRYANIDAVKLLFMASFVTTGEREQREVHPPHKCQSQESQTVRYQTKDMQSHESCGILSKALVVPIL